MRIETTEVMKPVVSKVFVADDGTVFENYNECVRYEEIERRRKIERCKDLMEWSESVPYGLEYVDTEAYTYLWLLPKTEADVEAIVAAFDESADIGEWICFEYRNDMFEDEGIRTHWFYDTVNDFTRMMDRLGYVVTVEKKLC